MNKSLGRLSRMDDLLITRVGDVFTGRIKNRSFEIAVETGGRYSFKREAINRIVYKNLPYFPADELVLLNGSILRGDITTTPILMDLGTGRPERFPKRAVVSVMFHSNWQLKRRRRS